MRVEYSLWHRKRTKRRYYKLAYRRFQVNQKKSPTKHYIQAITKQGVAMTPLLEKLYKNERDYEYGDKLFNLLLKYFYKDTEAGITLLYSKSRQKDVVFTRKLLCYVIYMYTRLSLKATTAIVCGNPDHSTTKHYLSDVMGMKSGYHGELKQKEVNIFFNWFETLYGDEYKIIKNEQTV